MQACLARLGLELYHKETSSLRPKVCMITAEVAKIRLLIYETWTLSAQNFDRLWSVHHRVPRRVTAFNRLKRGDCETFSYVKTLKQTRCDSIETAISQLVNVRDGGRKGGAQTGWADKNLAQIPCGSAWRVSSYREIRGTSPVWCFRVAIVVLTVAHNMGGKWYWGFLEKAKTGNGQVAQG